VYDWNDNRIITNLNDPAAGNNGTFRKEVVLTFDDGPSELLEPALDILGKHNIRAMFFWLGSTIDNDVQFERMRESGHIIGSHSFRHLNLSLLSNRAQRLEITRGIQALKYYTGERVNYFRPPYGRYNDDTLLILNELKVQPLFWDVASLDWELEESPEQIVENVREHCREGSILLLHELPQTIEILDDFIQALKQDGFQFTVPE
jgi:peptidoglycan/xylan/chitin deacetylase (PgdA/CDA1 family)